VTTEKKARALIASVIFSLVAFKIWQTYNYSQKTTLEAQLKVKGALPIARGNTIKKTEATVKPNETPKTISKTQSPIDQLLSRISAQDKNARLIEHFADQKVESKNPVYLKHGPLLATFVKTQHKPLLNTEEKNLLARQADDRNMIDGAFQILKQTPERVNNEDVIAHLHATRFLLEALDGKESTYVLKNIEDIIKEPSIEKLEASLQVRNFIAGDRAELMYGLLQFNPELSTEIKSALPGPISTKIFENVLKHRQVLFAEAATEFAQVSKEFAHK
jgi:hypothetical protein